jgi:hypothetical protein
MTEGTYANIAKFSADLTIEAPIKQQLDPQSFWDGWVLVMSLITKKLQNALVRRAII